MNKEARLNLLFFGIFLFVIVISSVFFVVADTTSVFNDNGSYYINYTSINGSPINEDVVHVFNLSINHTAGSRNVTNISIHLWGNFDFQVKGNGTGNVSLTDIFSKFAFSNTSDTLIWNASNSTSYIFPYNLSVVTNKSWFWFNATASTPGKYNITVRVGYNFSSVNETNITVHINDTSAPHIVNVTGGHTFGLNRSYANVSGTIIINVSVIDNGNLTAGAAEYDVTGVNITFFNSSNDANSSYLASNVSGKYWNISLDTTTLPDGVWNITIAANDTLGNINITNITNLRVDNTAPTGSVSCTPATVNTGDVVTCTCSVSDSLSGENSTATDVTASPSTSNTGTHTETCSFADMAGNTGSASATYTVEQSSSSSSGTSSGSSSTTVVSYTKTIPQTSADFSEIKTIETSSFGGGGLKAKERVKIKLNEEEHYIGVKELTETSATIEITSDPVQVELDIGEDAKVDLNEDNIYDVYVKLNGITGSVADLTITYLQEEIPEGEGAVSTTGEDLTTEDEVVDEEKDMTWLWVLIIALVLAIIIGAGIAVKKNKQ